MRFPFVFLNMIENDNSDSHAKVLLHITSNISKTNKQTKAKTKTKQNKNINIMGLHQSSRPPNFKSLPYPEVGGRFEIFFTY